MILLYLTFSFCVVWFYLKFTESSRSLSNLHYEISGDKASFGGGSALVAVYNELCARFRISRDEALYLLYRTNLQ